MGTSNPQDDFVDFAEFKSESVRVIDSGFENQRGISTVFQFCPEELPFSTGVKNQKANDIQILE